MKAKYFLDSHKITPTPLRVKIVRILQEASTPVSALEIERETGANKTTIYRNLDLLLAKDLLVKSEIDHKSFYELAGHAKAYFVCENCHKIEEINLPNLPGKNIKSAVIKGVCEECK